MHVKLLRLIGEPCSREEEIAEAAADHLEAVEAALRASTELLKTYYAMTYGKSELTENQIAANVAALGGG